MKARKIEEHIRRTYAEIPSPVCLLCSEATPERCHRRLVADYFAEVFQDSPIVHLVTP